MGLPRAAIHLLVHESARSHWQGRIGTLGRQHVYATYDEMKRFARGSSKSFRDVTPELHREPSLRKAGFMSDNTLYEFLGFEQSVRIDRSDYEGAEELLDLNSPDTPHHLMESFDLILDSGTIEHIFEIGRSLQHCLRMTKPGGRIIHITPSSNAVNHGFYSVSPSLFADYYQANGCEIERLCLCRMQRDFIRGTWEVYDCLNSDRNWLPLGRLDGSIWQTFVVVRKPTSGELTIPQQSFYLDTWQSSPSTSDEGSGSMQTNATVPYGKAERLLDATKNWKSLHAVATYSIDTWRHWINQRREWKRGKVPFPLIGRF